MALRLPGAAPATDRDSAGAATRERARVDYPRPSFPQKSLAPRAAEKTPPLAIVAGSKWPGDNKQRQEFFSRSSSQMSSRWWNRPSKPFKPRAISPCLPEGLPQPPTTKTLLPVASGTSGMFSVRRQGPGPSRSGSIWTHRPAAESNSLRSFVTAKRPYPPNTPTRWVTGFQ